MQKLGVSMPRNTCLFPSEAVDPGKIVSDQYADLLPDRLTGDPRAAAREHAERRQDFNRRVGSWRTFLYGNFRPRRRHSRRGSDQHQILFDWHEPRVFYLALGVLLLSCTDALFTLNLLNAGATEANAVMASMLEHSVDRFVSFKIGITALSVVTLVAVARRKFVKSFSVEHLLQIICAGYFLLICYEVYLFEYVFELEILPGHLLPW